MISVREARDGRRATDSGRQAMRIRDVQSAGPAFMSVEIWKWRFRWTSPISSRSVGNDFQQARGHQGNRHFHMPTISTPSGDLPTLGKADVLLLHNDPEHPVREAGGFVDEAKRYVPVEIPVDRGEVRKGRRE
jgi:hypothetical protein